MNLKNSQLDVDTWIKEHGVRYFNELTNMAQLTEEVGEVARIIARRYGEQSEKESDKNKDLGEELADVVFVVLCLANQTGIDLQAAFDKKMDMKSIPADKHKKYMDIADDAKEHAEHIGENVGNIHHQREHLASLGEDLKDLIDLFGTSQTLYQDHCPMFNDGKGAVWFSENKEIKNPYYGSKMMTCGKVEKTITGK